MLDPLSSAHLGSMGTLQSHMNTPNPNPTPPPTLTERIASTLLPRPRHVVGIAASDDLLVIHTCTKDQLCEKCQSDIDLELSMFSTSLTNCRAVTGDLALWHKAKPAIDLPKFEPLRADSKRVWNPQLLALLMVATAFEPTLRFSYVEATFRDAIPELGNGDQFLTWCVFLANGACEADLHCLAETYDIVEAKLLEHVLTR